MVANSSLSEKDKETILALPGNLFEVAGGYINKWDYLEMHQLEPITQRNPQNQKDIHKRLDWVMLNNKL